MTFSTYQQQRNGDSWATAFDDLGETMTFPAGEAHVTLRDAPEGSTSIAHVQGADANDLMALAMWADACRRQGRRRVALIPYLPGARADRGIPFGAKVYADFINSMGLDQVITFDPHSDVMPALLDRCTVVNLDQLPAIWTEHIPAVDNTPIVGVIAPDAGARKRAELVAGVLKVPVYQAFKHRDFATGRLSGFGCEPLPNDGRLLVVDDICDGGGTFVGLAATTGLPRDRLALWVSHGVFSKGAERLGDHYGLIASTNSHPGITPAVADTVYPLLQPLTDFITK